MGNGYTITITVKNEANQKKVSRSYTLEKETAKNKLQTICSILGIPFSWVDSIR